MQASTCLFRMDWFQEAHTASQPFRCRTFCLRHYFSSSWSPKQTMCQTMGSHTLAMLSCSRRELRNLQLRDLASGHSTRTRLNVELNFRATARSTESCLLTDESEERRACQELENVPDLEPAAGTGRARGEIGSACYFVFGPQAGGLMLRMWHALVEDLLMTVTAGRRAACTR